MNRKRKIQKKIYVDENENELIRRKWKKQIKKILEHSLVKFY